MSTHTRRVISYWQKSLADAELLDLRSLPGETYRFEERDLTQWEINDWLLHRLFEDVYAERGEKPPHQREKSPDDDTEYIDILIAPIVAERVYDHAYRNWQRVNHINPLIIPARLDEFGKIFPHPTRLPWIPRPLLEPMPTQDDFIGTMEQFDLFLTQETPNLTAIDDREWGEVVEFARAILRAVANDWRQTLEELEYEILDHSEVMGVTGGSGYNVNVQRTYDHLLRGDTFPPLLEAYVSPTVPQRRPPSGIEAWRETAMRHVGSNSAEFPLSPSQREALYNIIEQPPNSITAVNGPPGTGKTTLIQSIVANLWTQAALDQADPPLIAVSSTNNQAVTNVLDSFAKMAKIERWIDIPSYGLYLTSNEERRQQAQRKQIPVMNKYGNGFPDQIETEAFITNNREQFLQRYSKWTDQPIESVQVAVHHLHSLMQMVEEALREGIELAYTWHSRTELRAKYQAEGAQWESRLGELSAEIETLKNAEQAWLEHQQSAAWWLSAFRFLGFVQERGERRDLLFAREHLPDFAGTAGEIAAYIQQRRAEQTQEREQLEKAIAEAKSAEAQVNRVGNKWRKWGGWYGIPVVTALPKQLDLLDVNLRHELFSLATHYWEGRWLLEVERLGVGKPDFRDRRSRKGQIGRWRRYAMLTPCFVTTMQSGNAFFDYYNGENVPLLDTLDLLIVDEAGQVMPELSGSLFAIAKQAVVVGDTKQIEPIWSIPTKVDLANLQDQRLIEQEDDADEGVIAALRASDGSVMQLAQHGSSIQKPAQRGHSYEAGLFLAEHRRCVPEIIRYCNRLAYGGALTPKRPSSESHPLPPLGYVHIKGTAKQKGGSRANELEAMMVVSWLEQNQMMLEDYYQCDLNDTVAIITPFAAQKQLLKNLLKANGFHIETVGTVHALQGGERSVVLFSPVYDGSHQGNYFYDRSVNMLNVAVSRARDSFLVVGDMDLFDPERDTPSGLLGRMLFEHEENEIIDVPPPQKETHNNDLEIQRVATLAQHQQTLTEAFTRAKERLVIVSPYLRQRAVEADEITDLVAATVKRGVTIVIYVDKRFNDNLQDPSASAAAEMLTQAGAEVVVCRNIHSKILAVDLDWYVEGSFNWLSAERIRTEYQNYESSIVYSGKSSKQFIKRALRDLEQRALVKDN